ncbi:MAG TPA: hypothetical protein VFS60_10840 [Thermoanaerobaculia bacterium]|nr:hypothetical protein [Thermoanaerobaculia bacterium]
MASQHVAAFINKLSTDPSFRAAYKADPDAVMDQEGLSAEDKAVLKSGDPDAIKGHLGDDAPPGCFILFV